MIRYSERALRALTFFFQPYNDIDVYVEDCACRNVYEILCNRILGDKAKVTRVFQLGGFTEIVAECTRQSSSSNRRRLFLLDGDFALILNEAPPSLPCLYRLRVYSMENLLLCEQAMVEIVYEQASNRTKEDIRAVVAAESPHRQYEHILMSLFVLYAIAKTHIPSMPTAGHHVYRLCRRQDRALVIDLAMLRSRRSEVFRELSNIIGRQHVLSEYRRLRELLRAQSLSARHVVSGKTYLFPLVDSWFRRSAGYRGDCDSLKVRLARYCRLDIDPGLSGAVLAAARG